MSDAKLVNIARLMTTYNLKIEQLPDNLKCAQCKSVLKNACHGPCCCRFCRVCIDDIITRGGEFCPGASEECGESPLSSFVSDYGANKKISKLTVKCPHDWCVYEVQLVNIEEHLQECQRKSEKFPFREFGCTHDKSAAKGICGHLQQEYRRHNELLIEMISKINSEIETLKQRDEASSREIEILKQRDEVSSREIQTLKHELVQKDGQIRSIMDQMIHVQNENKLIKNDIKSIKDEKEDLSGRVRILEEEIGREIAERRENNELDLVRVIEHVDTEIAVVTRLIGSNKETLATDMQSVRGDMGSINQSVQSIKDDICSVKSQMHSVQVLVGLEQVDASFAWLIDGAVDKTYWYGGDRLSEYFTGELHLYKYRLSLWNWDTGTARAALYIQLRIYASPNDEQFTWPFKGRVIITVSDRDRRESCRSISLQCRIERPLDNDYRWSDEFKFLHSEVRGAGLNLSRGVCVSCVIVPATDR